MFQSLLQEEAFQRNIYKITFQLFVLFYCGVFIFVSVSVSVSQLQSLAKGDSDHHTYFLAMIIAHNSTALCCRFEFELEFRLSRPQHVFA